MCAIWRCPRLEQVSGPPEAGGVGVHDHRVRSGERVQGERDDGQRVPDRREQALGAVVGRGDDEAVDACGDEAAQRPLDRVRNAGLARLVLHPAGQERVVGQMGRGVQAAEDRRGTPERRAGHEHADGVGGVDPEAARGLVEVVVQLLDSCLDPSPCLRAHVARAAKVARDGLSRDPGPCPDVRHPGSTPPPLLRSHTATLPDTETGRHLSAPATDLDEWVFTTRISCSPSCPGDVSSITYGNRARDGDPADPRTQGHSGSEQAVARQLRGEP